MPNVKSSLNAIAARPKHRLSHMSQFLDSSRCPDVLFWDDSPRFETTHYRNLLNIPCNVIITKNWAKNYFLQEIQIKIKTDLKKIALAFWLKKHLKICNAHVLLCKIIDYLVKIINIDIWFTMIGLVFF